MRPAQAPLPSGKGEYLIRYNPAACLSDQPEVDFEVLYDQTAERVYIEFGPESSEVSEELREGAQRDPEGEWLIEGKLENRIIEYRENHRARVFSPARFVEKELQNQ